MSQPPSLADDSSMAAVPLISFRPPPEIQRAIDDRGTNWHIHAIEFAGGPLNLDNYRVKILKRPTVKGLDSLEGLLKYIRLNINEFVNTDDVEFTPYSSDDEAKWRSDNPAGSVIHIDFGNTAWGIPLGPFNLEDGSVVCSSYSKTHWTFSTIWTGGDANHPVSGNRQFGCYALSGPALRNGGEYIYTRAADRITDNIVNAFLVEKIFKGGHESWVGFQNRIASFVFLRGGRAEVLPPYSARHDWSKMKALHKPTVEWVIKTGHYSGPEKRDPDKEIRGKI
jgi:hypothetical protein